jgi:hypothetical protein
MHSRSRKLLLVATAVLLIIAIGFLPCPARGASPSYYIETLGGRAKIVDGTVSGLLDAYDIFALAMADSGANTDPAINGYYAAARMANILFRDDGTRESLVTVLHQYGYTLPGDDLGELDLVAPVDYDGNIILPEDAPSLETLRNFLATSLMTEIDGALGNLGVITDSFKEIIPAIDINSDMNLEIDYGDILLYQAGLKALKTAILTATAYDLDLDPHVLVTPINADLFNIKRLLDYYPDLLKLLPTSTTSGDGAGQLSLAKTTLEAAISDYLAASDEMRNDPGTEAGAEEFFAISNCGLREEQFFRNMLSELKRSLQATDVANLIAYQEESWIIHDVSDPNKEMEVEFDETEGEFWSTNWPDLFLAGGGDVDCITESGGTTTLYLALWAGPCSEGEATLTATYMDATTVSGDFSVDYYDDSNPSCTDHSGTFSGTREVFEETLNINLNPLFAASFSLRDLLPEFDTYGEPLPGTMGHGVGDDATLGGILISLEEDGEVTSFTQDFWTRELELQPGGIVQIPEVVDDAISVEDGILSDWGVFPVLQDVSDDEEWDDPVGDVAALYLAKDTNNLYIRMSLHDGPVNQDPNIFYSFGVKPHYDAPFYTSITAYVGWDPSAQGGTGAWHVQVIRWSDYSILFDQESGYGQAVGNDVEWKVPLSAMENLNGGFILASTETWGEDIDYNGTRLLIGPVATIRGEITGPFAAQTGVLGVAVYKYGLPIEPEYIMTRTSYLGTEISNPLSYELEGVPMNVPLLIMASWGNQLNGIAGVEDLWGGYTEDPANFPATPKPITTDPTESLDITLSESYPMQISGTVNYSIHSESGNRNLTIWGSTAPSFIEHQVLFSQAVAPGSNPPIDYGLSGLPPDRYFLYYFLDLNQNNEPDLGEPFAYQGYHPPGPDLGYEFISLLDLGAQPQYTDVDAVLHPASLDPSYFNVYHEQRPNAPYLIVAYTPYAPFPLISSVLVNGDNLLSTVDITGGTDDWHEYWYMIPASSFTGGVIPIGQHTYTITVQTDATTEQYSNTPYIDPLNWVTQVAPADLATVSTTPTFQWNSVAGAVRYRLELADETGFWIYQGYIDAPTTTHTLPDGKIFPGRTYRWRMTAFDPNGTDGSYDNRSRSVWRNFTVMSDTATISGQVLDHNGGPLQGAKVEALLGGNVIASDTTDASGGYGLSVPIGNTYTIRVTAPGYARDFADTPGVVSGDLQNFNLTFDATDVDNIAPSISNLDPTDGSTVSEGRPEISAILSDGHAGIDPETIVFTLDGVQVNVSYSEIDGRVSFTPNAALANGSHTVAMDVQDYAQNPATQAAWSFTVDVKVVGDLNCDYSIDLADAIIALQVLIDNPPQTFCFSDVDGDGKIGLAEALYVLQKIAGFRGDHFITYTYVQYRRYAGSDPHQRRIWVEIYDSDGMKSGDVLRSLTVKDPNGTPLSFLYLDYSQEVTYFSRYNDSTGGWDEYLNGNLSTGYYGRIDTNSLEIGDYTFTAVDINGETLPSVTYTFNGEESNLPVVDSNTINPIWHGDGRLTIQWTTPDTTGLDPNDWRSEVAIEAFQDGQYSGHGYYGRGPLTHGYVELSADMVAKLQSLGDELRCRVRIRKNDNSQRSYSNSVTIWSRSYPSNYKMDYTYVQYRRYGDGSSRRQIWVDVRDSGGNLPGDVLSSLELLDNSGQPFNFSSLGFSQSTEYYAWYNPASGGWDENLQGTPAAGYWGRIDTPSLGPGNYTFTAVDTSQQDLRPRTYIFKGEYPNLPVVDSNTINTTWNGDGSLTIDWDLPAEAQSLDPAEWRMDVFIDVRQGGSGTGHGYFGRVPLDLTPQHIDLSPAMVAKLQSLGDELHCRVRVRKNDNSQ